MNLRPLLRLIAKLSPFRAFRAIENAGYGWVLAIVDVALMLFALYVAAFVPTRCVFDPSENVRPGAND